MNKKLFTTIDRYIKNTPRKGYVKDLRIKICNLPRKFRATIKAKDLRIYISTKALKHMYDSRNAQEFDFITQNIEAVMLQPKRIYANKDNKTGDFCFYTEFEKSTYFFILEIQHQGIYIVSAYRLSDIEEKRENYLAGYKLLWSWKGDLPSS